jgi:NAD(P)-dependent dehydrogenase (short-subunit alcohol dehydrogenase family)
MFRYCDIINIPALQNTIAELAAELGDFDVLVNNAANNQRHDIGDVSVAYWDERIAINQRPMFFTCQAVLEGMKQKGAGSIINFSSMAWHAKGGGYPVYATTKAAVIGLTRSLARDPGKYGIRVNTVTPGWVMTQRQLELLGTGIYEGMWVGPASGVVVEADAVGAVLRIAADDIGPPGVVVACGAPEPRLPLT